MKCLSFDFLMFAHRLCVGLAFLCMGEDHFGFSADSSLKWLTRSSVSVARRTATYKGCAKTKPVWGVDQAKKDQRQPRVYTQGPQKTDSAIDRCQTNPQPERTSALRSSEIMENPKNSRSPELCPGGRTLLNVRTSVVAPALWRTPKTWKINKSSHCNRQKNRAKSLFVS